MSHNGQAHSSFRNTHSRNETPTGVTIFTGLAAFLPVAFLALRGTSGVDVYGWLGMMAVYGFVVSHGLVCFALSGYLRDYHGVSNVTTKTIPYAECAAMVYALVANLYPVTHDVYGKLPYVFLTYLFDDRRSAFCFSLAGETFDAGWILSGAQFRWIVSLFFLN
jgi:amino acid transporter